MVLRTTRDKILNFIDFFHKPFEKWINKQTFRYLACGGSNTLLDIFIYWFSYHYILMENAVELGSITISPHIAAFMISFSISFPLGFTLAKYVVFQESNLRGRVQLFRYALLVATCILLNYIFLKLFVESFGWFPTPSKVVTTIIVALFSYFSQRKFTFKVKKESPEAQ